MSTLTIKPEITSLAWCWRSFGGQPMLVTDGCGAMVVLAPSKAGAILTRDLQTGTLRKLAPSDEVAKIIGAAPDLRRCATSLINGIDIGLVTISSDADDTLLTILSGMRRALAKSGAA